MKQFILYILLNCAVILPAQTSVYEIVFFGDSIGSVEVEKNQLSENRFSYHFNSEAETEVLFVKIKTKAITELVFENNLLQEAYVLRVKNGDIHELTYNWDQIKYRVKDNEDSLFIEKEISYCTANFFFSETLGVYEVFVERFNYFVPIEHLGENKYLTRVDGGTNLYSYKNGVLQSLKSKKGVSVFMKLKK